MSAANFTSVLRAGWSERELDGAGRVQQLAARVSFAALLVALVGPSMDQVIAGLGWALASSSIVAWSGSLITRKLLTARSRMDTGDA